MRGRAWIAATGAAAAAALCAPLPAGAAGFGANLANAPNGELTCGQNIPPTNLYAGRESCLYFSSNPAQSLYAPASGTVTAVHVRVGPVTGPMQVVVLRSLYQNKPGEPGKPYFACCFVERYGPVFTPQPNAITNIPTDLPVVEEPTPQPDDFTTNAAADFLALSVLAPNVPVPIAVDGQTYDTGFYPAPTEQSFPAPSPIIMTGPAFTPTDFVYGQLLLSGDLETAGGGGGGAPPAAPANPGAGGGGPAPAPPAPPLPAVTFPRTLIPVRGGKVAVPVECLVANCGGLLSLQSAPLAGAASAASAAKHKTVTYGSVSFSLKAGTTAKVKLKLNRAGANLLHSRHTAKVWANVTFTGAGKPKSTRITLKR